MSRSLTISRFLLLTPLMVASSISCLPAMAQSFGDAFSTQSVHVVDDSIIHRYVSGVIEACSHKWPDTREKFHSPLVVGFSIKHNGTVKDLELVRTSGIKKWDKKAIAAVKAAQPFGKMQSNVRNELPILMEFKSGPPVHYTYTGESLSRRVRVQGRITRTRFLDQDQSRAVLCGFNPMDEDSIIKKKPVVSAQSDVDFGPYMAGLQRRIRSNFTPVRVNENLRVILVFKIWKDGRVTNTRLVTRSGNANLDANAIAAITASSPLRSLPEGAPEDVDIQYTFDQIAYYCAGKTAIDLVVHPFGVPTREIGLAEEEQPDYEFWHY
ncbi:MAG: TonB C-terminal domain-containing protein [Cyanobacteria bacterium]|nr:TonB C-terminal domain-containing protein [Cyanobacteriota bacterium]